MSTYRPAGLSSPFGWFLTRSVPTRPGFLRTREHEFGSVSADRRPRARASVRARAPSEGVWLRSRATRMPRTTPASRRPSPTATSVPTRVRTIWCRNAFARAEISTRSPTRAIESRWSRRTVPPDCGLRQNDAKSCSPSSARAAARIGANAIAPGRCQTNRASNGSGHGPVAIRYRYSRAVAENRASKPSAARRTSHATTSGASIPLTDRWRRSSSTSSSTTNDATCPRACTPASVRPATESFGARPKTRRRASDRAPSTVRCPEFRAHPRNPDPSYASETRTITPPSMTRVTDRNGARGGGRLGRPRASRKHQRSHPSTARRAARGDPRPQRAKRSVTPTRTPPARSAPSVHRRPAAARA